MCVLIMNICTSFTCLTSSFLSSNIPSNTQDRSVSPLPVNYISICLCLTRNYHLRTTKPCLIGKYYRLLLSLFMSGNRKSNIRHSPTSPVIQYSFLYSADRNEWHNDIMLPMLAYLVPSNNNVLKRNTI